MYCKAKKKNRSDQKIFENLLHKKRLQSMLILGLLGMYFDAAVVFVTSQTLLLRLAVAKLCWIACSIQKILRFFNQIGH